MHTKNFAPETLQIVTDEFDRSTPKWNADGFLAVVDVGDYETAAEYLHVFGAITLHTQQPVRVGDFCRFGNETGTIEEIGLRTTRIRTLANTLIAIPNARLASQPIDNISARSKILYRPTLRLKYDTTNDFAGILPYSGRGLPRLFKNSSAA